MSEKHTNVKLTSLFLQSSLDDSKSDFKRSLSHPEFPHWDVVILTASNEFQAEGYRKQIEYRRSHGRLPENTEFIIVPDKDNKRVGSAGSTLSVIRELKSRFGTLSGRRFLCIHAGGDSKRCPQYSALGKLFSPVPTAIDGVPATLFDMFMVTMASVPGRMRDGMLLLSGDVILLFNPLMCDFGTSEAAVISFKEDVQTGKNHGVYLKSESGNVRKFLHKQSVETLTSLGAVDERGNCSIDTGAIELSPVILEKLYSLVDTEEKYDAIVNDKVRLSLYGDIAYCLAEDSTLESFYNEKPEGEFCDELTSARTALWNAISEYNMKLLNLAPAKFVHFGSIPEILGLMNGGVADYDMLGWKNQVNSSVERADAAAYNSVLTNGASIGTGCYLECSYIHHEANVGNNCLLSFVDIHHETVPDNVVLHGLKQNNGKFVCRIFDINDNPKGDELFGKKLSETGLTDADMLWNAEIYPECDKIGEAVEASLNLYNIVTGNGGDFEAWKNAPKKSLCSGFNDADPQAIIDWSKRMEDYVRMDELSKLIDSGRPASEGAAILQSSKLTKIQEKWLVNHINRLDTDKLEDFSRAIRYYWYIGTALGDEKYQSECFRLISDTILKSTLNNLKYDDTARIAHDKTVIKLPLRVNWGGGWTDTPPHCLELGGKVLNAAIKLNGEYPVEVTMIKIAENKIVFDSRDMDTHGEFEAIEPLQNTGDPYDPFALQKACLLATGIIPKQGGNLADILERLGGGFEMHTEVTNVPKGSGLGTSSILSAAAVKAVFEFTGKDYTDDDLYSHVLAMEQIMSTGGGWQDQVGGVTNGIKYITSEKGIDQVINVEKVQLGESAKAELNKRFCLIYTGQRRLARNLLRDVVGRYVGNEPESIFAHKEIQVVADKMKAALENGDIDEFAHLLSYHWDLSKKIDAGTTNTLLEQILITVDDLIEGKFVSGAGGGGFMQVILKKGVTKEQVHKKLKEVFQDFDVDVWECEIVY